MINNRKQKILTEIGNRIRIKNEKEDYDVDNLEAHSLNNE